MTKMSQLSTTSIVILVALACQGCMIRPPWMLRDCRPLLGTTTTVCDVMSGKEEQTYRDGVLRVVDVIDKLGWASISLSTLVIARVDDVCSSRYPWVRGCYDIDSHTVAIRYRGDDHENLQKIIEHEVWHSMLLENIGDADAAHSDASWKEHGFNRVF